MSKGPKILLIDIETAPHRVYTWGLFNQNVHLDQIEEPGYTLCFAAKWYGRKQVIFKSVHHDGTEAMLQAAHDLLTEADIVVHYNGVSFDMPTLNGEFLQHGMKPPAPYHQIDLLLAVRSNFRLASNKLDYVLRRLELGSKVQHKGMELWNECMRGDESGWRTMKKYNIGDVVALEPLYEAVRPWIKKHPNIGLWVAGDEPTCTNCGSTNLVSHGIRHSRVHKYRRFQCQDCGTWSRERLRAEKPAAGILT